MYCSQEIQTQNSCYIDNFVIIGDLSVAVIALCASCGVLYALLKLFFFR